MAKLWEQFLARESQQSTQDKNHRIQKNAWYSFPLNNYSWNYPVCLQLIKIDY